jgi:hypothetical protein
MATSNKVSAIVCRYNKQPEVALLSEDEFKTLLDEEIFDGWGESKLCEGDSCLMSEFVIRFNGPRGDLREHVVGNTVVYGTGIILLAEPAGQPKSGWAERSLNAEDVDLVLRALKRSERGERK